MNATAIAWLVSLVAAFAVGYHFGGLGPKLKDASAAAKVERQEVTTLQSDAARINQEAKTFENAQDPALDPIPAPSVRLCHYTRAPSVDASPSAGPGAPAPVPLRAADPGPDIGPGLRAIGRQADAQVAGLIDYIYHVCPVKAP